MSRALRHARREIEAPSLGQDRGNFVRGKWRERGTSPFSLRSRRSYVEIMRSSNELEASDHQTTGIPFQVCRGEAQVKREFEIYLFFYSKVEKKTRDSFPSFFLV